MLDYLPALPMDLPEMMSPASSGSRRIDAKPAEAPDKAAAPMLMVDALRLSIDDRFGLDVDALPARYAGEVSDARDRLSAGLCQSVYPLVLRAEDGRYVALTGFSTVAAAIELARATSSPVMLAVIVQDTVDGEALLRNLFDRPRGASLFEQACYIAGCENKYGSRRAWMRAEGIPAAKWEPRFSKVAKIRKLDKRLLARIDPHTISNAEVSGRIVDACGDVATRRTVVDMVEIAATASKSLLNAGPLFRRIDAALHPAEPAYQPGDWNDGTLELRNAGGSVVATLTRDGAGWSIAGTDRALLTRAVLACAIEALNR